MIKRREFSKRSMMFIAASGLFAQKAIAQENKATAPQNTQETQMTDSKKQAPLHFAILLFDNFETLDVFGPVEMFGFLQDDFELEFYSPKGGLIRSYQNVRVQTKPLSELPKKDYVFFVPGGRGVRQLLNDESYLNMLVPLTENAKYVMTVCTGTALLAKAGLLKGKKATTNKLAYDFVIAQGPQIEWVKHARWVIDGNVYTSSGVSAGTDMALAFIADQKGIEEARNIACLSEYIWNEDPNNDPFAADDTPCRKTYMNTK